MNILDRPCSSPKEAFMVAQGHCIHTKGSDCEAYDGVSCPSCPKYKEGLKRRKERIKKEKKQTLGEVVIDTEPVFKSKTIMRLRKTDSYYRLEIGKVYKDQPDLFREQRSIGLTHEEKEIAVKLLTERG
ncbi:MAG: hypothetical protein ABIJ28_00955 [Patescibacteria group bacterium]|nr:hypothetical protein [Patescibacteria group bacterium]